MMILGGLGIYFTGALLMNLFIIYHCEGDGGEFDSDEMLRPFVTLLWPIVLFGIWPVFLFYRHIISPIQEAVEKLRDSRRKPKCNLCKKRVETLSADSICDWCRTRKEAG